MAGHSKWANIQHRKGKADKARAKLFSKLAKEITVAAKAGMADVNFNPLYVFASAPVAREGQPPPPAPVAAITADKANYANVSVILTDFTTIPSPEPLDLVWTSQNYHDMHNPGRNLDINAANKAVFNALKPGGVYIVLDHQSAKGVDFNAQLHRIDKEKVKAEVIAAGFQYVGESTVLANPNDDGTKVVFDPSVRRNTNQFILKFKRPA